MRSLYEKVQSGTIKLGRGRVRDTDADFKPKEKRPRERGEEVEPTSEFVLRRKQSPLSCPHKDAQHLCDVSAIKKKGRRRRTRGLFISSNCWLQTSVAALCLKRRTIIKQPNADVQMLLQTDKPVSPVDGEDYRGCVMDEIQPSTVHRCVPL